MLQKTLTFAHIWPAAQRFLSLAILRFAVVGHLVRLPKQIRRALSDCLNIFDAGCQSHTSIAMVLDVIGQNNAESPKSDYKVRNLYGSLDGLRATKVAPG